MFQSLFEFFHPETIIRLGGVALLLFVVFAETGLFFGFFLPGDALLFVAGVMTNSKYIAIPLWWLVVLVVIATVAGTSLGYCFGYWFKNYFYSRKENFFYRKSYLEITQRLYSKYGMVAFIIGRYLPVVRTFVPIFAGIVQIELRKFFIYNTIGAITWAVPLILAGYWLGSLFPNITAYLEMIVVAMILLTSLPFVIAWRNYRKLSSVRKITQVDRKFT